MTPKRIPKVPSQHRDRIDMTKVPTPQFIKTREEWLSLTEPVQPADIFLLERQSDDTIKIKVSDGERLYIELPYIVDYVVSGDHYGILENMNEAGGVLVLNSEARIEEKYLPIIYTGRLKVANSYAEMVTKGEDEDTGYKFKQGPVMVINATDDPDGSVQAGGGYYVWVEDLDTPSWVKISEFKEPDSTLEEYFKFTGIEHHTIGVISDDVDDDQLTSDKKYRKFSYADYEVLYGLSTESDSNTVKYNHAVYCTALDMNKLAQLMVL